MLFRSGVVLNGARLKDDLRLAIIVNNDYRHVSWIKAMEVAINRRFYYQEGGKQRTVAVAKNDYEIQLGPFPKYQLDPAHYLGTVMSIGFGESQGQVAERVRGCQRMLGSPDTARKAAWELEAIGTPEATEVLNLALANHDDEIRFYAAYSLAYLDRPESVPILQNLAKYQPKYRAHCLIGLCINDHPSARTALEGLLQEPESEVRYGAYHYLRQRDPRNPMVVGEPIGESFRCVQIPTTNPGIFVSMERRPEIVLMGGNQQLQIPKQLEPTPWLRITPLSSGLIRVAKRAMTGEINQTIITADIISLIKAMPAIGGNYGDIVHALDAVSQINGCSAPIAFHPLPRTDRKSTRLNSSHEWISRMPSSA